MCELVIRNTIWIYLSRTFLIYILLYFLSTSSSALSSSKTFHIYIFLSRTSVELFLGWVKRRMGFLLSLRWKKSYKTFFRYSLEGEGSGFHTCLFVPKIWLEFFEPLPKNFPENSYVCVIRGIQIGPCKYIVIITLSRFESMERCRDNLTTMAQWWDVGDGIIG